MKHLYLLLFVLMTPAFLFAQEAEEEAAVDTVWKFGGFAQINLNQVALVNWAAGGNSSVSAAVLGNAFANFKRNRLSWNNSFDGNLGIIRQQGAVRKNEDRLELNSDVNYEFRKHWQLTTLMNFKSQFAYGFEFPGDADSGVLVSKFAAPAYLVLSQGITFRPNDWFHVYVSPATGKFNIVRSDANIDPTRYGVGAGDVVRAEFGAYLTTVLKYEIMKNVTLWTKLDLFNNFTDPNRPNRREVDLDWQVRIDMKVNKYISASIQSQLIYDYNILIPIDKDGDGITDINARRFQFREALAISFGYKFNAHSVDRAFRN